MEIVIKIIFSAFSIILTKKGKEKKNVDLIQLFLSVF